MFSLACFSIVENNTSTVWKEYRRLSTMADVVCSVNKDANGHN